MSTGKHTSSNYMEFNVSLRENFTICHVDIGVPAMVWVTSAFGTANSETYD